MKIKFIVFLLLVFSLIGLSSCDNETNTPTPPVTGQTNYYVDFTVDSLNVYIYDTAILPLDTDADTANLTIVSSNDSVVKVEGLKIKSISKGSATITATTSNGKSDTMTVTVVDDGNVPFLSLPSEDVDLLKNSQYPINAKVQFRGEEVQATYTYNSSNPDIVSVDENGMLTTHSLGEATINIYANYNGYSNNEFSSLHRTMTVVVKPTVVFNIDADNLIVNTRTELINGVQYLNEVNLSGSLLTDGETKKLADINCQWISSNEEVVTIENNKIVGHKEGNAVIYAQTTIDNVVYKSNSLNVSVEKPTIVIENLSMDIDLSSDNVVIPTDIMLNGDNSILNVYDKEEPSINIYNDGKLQNYDELGPRKWIIESTNNNYQIDVVCCSKIITTKDELASLHTFGKNVIKGEDGIISYEGYFILSNNIDMKGTRFRTNCGISTGATSYIYNGFIGVFDGRGYTISNATVAASNSGLFPTLNVNSVIKNVAFLNASVSGDSGLISSNFGGKLENVYVEGKLNCTRATALSSSSLLASNIYDGAKISNCIVKVLNPTTNNVYSSAIGMLVTAKEEALENVYVLGTDSKSLTTSIGDKYSSLKNDSNGQFANYSDLLLEDLSTFNNYWIFGETEIEFSSNH